MTPFHPLARRDRVPAAELAGASYGLFIVSGSPLMAEACASRGPDWLVLDMEASDAGRRELTQMLQALNGAHAFGIARVPSNTRQQIEAALDAGAHGLIVPKVSSAAEARAVVDAAFYPPKGTRGLNPIRSSAFFTDMPDYFAHANARVLVGVQIETAEALRNLPEIAAVNGIDCCSWGAGTLRPNSGIWAMWTMPMCTPPPPPCWRPAARRARFRHLRLFQRTGAALPKHGLQLHRHRQTR